MFGEAYISRDMSTMAAVTSDPTTEDYSPSSGTWDPFNTSDAMDTNGTEEHRSRGNLDKYLWMYISPVIFIVGFIGNILCIAVLSRRKFHGTTTHIYLPAVAAADTAVLIFGIIPEWLEYSEFVTFKEIHPWTCKLEKFLFYTSGDTAIWILVLFTFDRFVAVCFPFKKRVVCQPKRAIIACFVVFLLAICKNLHVFWTRGPQYDDDTGELRKTCGRPHPYTYFELYVRPWIAFSIVMVVPFLIIIVCNTLIIRTLLKAKRMRSESASGSDKGFLQTTAMCLSASFAFLIFIAPSLVLLIGSPYWTDDDYTNENYNIAKAINNQLVYVNHSINFFLYCVTGAKFREGLMELFHCKDNEANNHLSYYNKAYKTNSCASAATRCTDGGTTSTQVTPKFNKRSPSRKPENNTVHVEM